MNVMKFGGTSLGSPELMTKCAELIEREINLTGENPLVIVSAIGGTPSQPKVTDLLLLAAENAVKGEWEPYFRAIEDRHHEILEGLGLPGEISDNMLSELEDLLRGIQIVREATPRLYDFAVSFGERICAKCFTALLRKRGHKQAEAVNSYDLGLVTDSRFMNASPLLESYDRIREFYRQYDGKLLVVTGFIAKDKLGEFTTIGRSGSDFSAAIFGSAIGAKEIQVWKDVPGVLTADPSLIPHARPLERLSFSEASELAYYGAEVLHPATLVPAIQHGIPVRVLYTFNPVVAYTNGFAWNHDVVTFCVVLSFWLFACTDIRQGPHPWRLASMGALLTFATCMRVTTVLAGAVFLAAIAITAGGSIRNRVRTALPFIIAGILTLLWPLWTVMRAPRAAWLNLVRIPALYGRWLHELGLAYDKVSLTIDCLATPGYLSVLVLTGCLVAVVLMRRSRLGGAMRRNLFVASALAAVFCLIAFIPPTMWHQYWAVPVPFLVIVCAYPIAALRQAADEAGGRRSFRVACGLVVVAATVAVVANLNVLRRLPAVLVPERWAPVALHDVATDVARKTAGHGRVLTLGPLYALEGGCDIYPALASGSIIYRVADAMSAEDRRITHTVGLGTLGALLDQSPPSAVILGVEPSHFSHLEEPLFRAVGPGWLCEVHEYGIEVYFRP